MVQQLVLEHDIGEPNYQGKEKLHDILKLIHQNLNIHHLQIL